MSAFSISTVEAKIIAGRRQRPEDVFEIAREYLVGGAATLDHWNPVFFGHGRIGEREIAGERSQQKIDLVLRHQLRVLAHAQVDVGLVVVELERQLVRFIADLDAARGVDLVDRKLIGVAIVATGIGKRPRQLYGRSQDNVFCKSTIGWHRESDHRYQQEG